MSIPIATSTGITAINARNPVATRRRGTTLGRRSDLRGYTSGEHVARNLLSTQAEYRWMLNDRWGLVGFFGVARLYDGGIDEGENFSSGGVGVRLRLHQANRVNLRVDFAWGENDEDGFYVSLREAF